MKTTAPTMNESRERTNAHALARRIAGCLTGPARWIASAGRTHSDAEPRPHYAVLTRPTDGAEIGVTLGGYRAEGRVSFRAHWPQFAGGGSYTPRTHLSITCNAARSAEALARDIERRLLPDYEPAFRDACAYVNATDAAETEAQRAAERLAHAIGAERPAKSVHRPSSVGAPIELWGGPCRARRIKVHPAHSDVPVRVSFEVDGVDEATAGRLLALLADAKKGQQ